MIPSQSGNALFIVLISIALFSALSFVVMSSTRSNTSSSAKETARLQASIVMQQGAKYQQGFVRLIALGCDYNAIDTSDSTYQRLNGTILNSANVNAPSDRKCHLFDPKGGNINAAVIGNTALVMDNPLLVGGNGKPGHLSFRTAQIARLGIDGTAGTAEANDLYMNNGGLKRDVCLAINDLAKVQNPGGNPPTDIITGGLGQNNGSGYQASTAIFSHPAIEGKHIFCHYYTSINHYEYVHVFLER